MVKKVKQIIIWNGGSRRVSLATCRFSIKHVTNNVQVFYTLYKDVDVDKVGLIGFILNTYLGFITPPNDTQLVMVPGQTYVSHKGGENGQEICLFYLWGGIT